MNANSVRASALASWWRVVPRRFPSLGSLRNFLRARSQRRNGLAALAAVEDDELHCLSEFGQRLRREARRSRGPAALCGNALAWVSAAVVAAVVAAPAVAQRPCLPGLVVKQSGMAEPRGSGRERIWSALVSVDASACTASAGGSFRLALLRLKENAPDLQFSEDFQWQAPAVRVEVPFASDEAVAGAWIESVTPCACAR